MKILLTILAFLYINPLLAQNWFDQLDATNGFIASIAKGNSWDSLSQIAKSDSISYAGFYDDISQTIHFKKKATTKSNVDSLFLIICDSTFHQFPFRRSGHLDKRYYTVEKPKTTQAIFPSAFGNKSLYPQIAQILNGNKNIIIPQLILFLENDAATRLTIKPIDYDEKSFYISISDLAMELLEMISFCDFYDNASNHNLYSNLDTASKNNHILKVEKWYEKTKNMTRIEGVEYYLDSLCPFDASYHYTCNNLLFAGDSSLAKEKYQQLYKARSMPCKIDHDIGKILLSLGDRIILEDCMNKSFNYRCMDASGKRCIDILLDAEHAYYRDEFFAEIIATEPHSRFRKSGTGPNYIWHKIFGEMAEYDKFPLALTLIELMKIEEAFSSLNDYHTYKWKRTYSKEIKEGYRICDLALLKYHQTIQPLQVTNWAVQKERDLIRRKLISADK